MTETVILKLYNDFIKKYEQKGEGNIDSENMVVSILKHE